ncbi:MAG: hypothetical protein R3E65_03630 [Steroidobacteraceae bacterium]
MSWSHMFFALIQLVLGVVGFGGPAGVPETKSNLACAVAGVHESIERALCAPEPGALFRAMRVARSAVLPPNQRMSVSERLQGEEAYDAQLQVLMRVFRGDRSVGRAIPWDIWNRDPFRVELAERLAQAARNGRATVDLREIQNFARTHFDAQRGTPNQATIHLLGYANITDRLDALRRIAMEGDKALVPAVIVALASMCGESALRLLREILELPRIASAYPPDRVEEVLSSRASNTRSWCGRGVAGAE